MKKAYWLSIYPHWKLLLARPIIDLRSVVNLAAFVALSLNDSYAANKFGHWASSVPGDSNV
jgi:hypothetical protein